MQRNMGTTDDYYRVQDSWNRSCYATGGLYTLDGGMLAPRHTR